MVERYFTLLLSCLVLSFLALASWDGTHGTSVRGVKSSLPHGNLWLSVSTRQNPYRNVFSCLLTDDVAIFPSGTFFNYIDKIRFTKSSQKLPKKKPKVNLDTCELLHGNGRWSERPRNV